jgi:hypothetical protein
MKKCIVFFVAICLATTVFGQEKKHAVGLRYGIVSQTDIELTYQYYLNEISRLEFGLGTAEYLIQSSLIYQLVGNLSAITPGLKVYGGAGLIVGTYSSKTGVGVAAQGGLEYNFRIPLQVSLDYRPKVFFPSTTYHYDDLSISLRYKF